MCDGDVSGSRFPPFKVKELEAGSFHTSFSAGNEEGVDAVSLSQIVKPSALWDWEMQDVNLRRTRGFTLTHMMKKE